ncbi:MAG TPA: hypothetical protein VF135_13805 [Terriglobales bacterium]
MKSARRFICLVCFLFLLSSGSFAQSQTTSRHSVSLKAGDAVISAVVLTNTHTRSFTDISRPPMTPNQCNLEPKAEGVIWKVVLEGVALSAKDVVLVAESGKTFQQVCWSSSGTVYKLDSAGNRTGGGPQTEFLAAGPDKPSKITIRVGSTSVVITPEKAQPERHGGAPEA